MCGPAPRRLVAARGCWLVAVVGLFGIPAASAAEARAKGPAVVPPPGAELFAATNIWPFRLDIDAAGMKSLREEPREWARATLRAGDEIFPDVAVHIKGSEGSLQPIDARPSLTVSINKFAAGRKYRGLRKIHFNNTAEDPSFMTEILCGDLCRRSGVPAARSGYATLTLNGRRLGLYVLKEGLTKEFLAQFFERTHGNLYDSGFRKDIDQELERIGGDGPEDQSDRLALLAAARESDPARRWERLQKVLDTDRFLSLLALTTFTWNWDGYPMSRNNYRLYHDPETDKMVFIPHGLDQMFWEPQGPIYPRMNGIVASAVMRIPEARKRYRERLAVLHTNVFSVPLLTDRIDQLAVVIRPHKPDVDVQAARLKQRIAGRSQSIAQQLQTREPWVPQFTSGVARLTDWSKSGTGQPGLDQVRVGQGTNVLRIRHQEAATSAWVTRVSLPAGTYELIGRARGQHSDLTSGDRFAGAGLRASAMPRVSSPRPQLGQDWQELRCRFTSRGPEESIELACELRNAQGEIWFDQDSLRLQRITPTAGSRLLDFLVR